MRKWWDVFWRWAASTAAWLWALALLLVAWSLYRDHQAYWWRVAMLGVILVGLGYHQLVLHRRQDRQEESEEQDESQSNPAGG